MDRQVVLHQAALPRASLEVHLLVPFARRLGRTTRLFATTMVPTAIQERQSLPATTFQTPGRELRKRWRISERKDIPIARSIRTQIPQSMRACGERVFQSPSMMGFRAICHPDQEETCRRGQAVVKGRMMDTSRTVVQAAVRGAVAPAVRAQAVAVRVVPGYSMTPPVGDGHRGCLRHRPTR